VIGDEIEEDSEHNEVDGMKKDQPTNRGDQLNTHARGQGRPKPNVFTQ